MSLLQPPDTVILVDLYSPRDGEQTNSDLFLRLDVAIDRIFRFLIEEGCAQAAMVSVSTDNQGQVDGVGFFSKLNPQALWASAAVYHPLRDRAEPELHALRSLSARTPQDLQRQLTQALQSHDIH